MIVRSANEFHIDGLSAAAVFVIPGDDVGDPVAFVSVIDGPPSAIASGAADSAALIVFGWRESGVLCRRKGLEVRGARCEEMVGRTAPRARLSLGVKMEGELFIPGARSLA